MSERDPDGVYVEGYVDPRDNNRRAVIVSRGCSSITIQFDKRCGNCVDVLFEDLRDAFAEGGERLDMAVDVEEVDIDREINNLLGRESGDDR